MAATTTFFGLPGVKSVDDDQDGKLNWILVTDAPYRHFSFDGVAGDGACDSYEFSTGIGLDSLAFRDGGMDGQYDLRIGPGRAIAIAVDSRWQAVVHKVRQSYVELDGKLVKVQLFPVVRIIDDQPDESAFDGE